MRNRTGKVFSTFWQGFNAAQNGKNDSDNPYVGGISYVREAYWRLGFIHQRYCEADCTCLFHLNYTTTPDSRSEFVAKMNDYAIRQLSSRLRAVA